MKNRNLILMIISSAIVFVVGVMLLMRGMIDYREALLSADWPSVPGSITDSYVKISSSAKGGTTYSARISYTYSVHGKQYTGSKINFGALLTSLAGAQGIVDRYPVGKSLTVFYNPNDNSAAVLEPGYASGVWFSPGVGGVTAFVGGGMLIALVAAYRRNNPPKSETFGLPGG
jgi:hypothetical protein